MGKARIFFDSMTVILIFFISMIVSALIFSPGNPEKIKNLFTPLMIFAVIGFIYTISIIILGIRKSTKFLHGFAIFIGSIIVPIILPMIYYLTYLRKLMGAYSQKEQFEKLMKKIQENPELLK